MLTHGLVAVAFLGVPGVIFGTNGWGFGLVDVGCVGGCVWGCWGGALRHTGWAPPLPQYPYRLGFGCCIGCWYRCLVLFDRVIWRDTTTPPQKCLLCPPGLVHFSFFNPPPHPVGVPFLPPAPPLASHPLFLVTNTGWVLFLLVGLTV